ncbi:MAG: cytochrome c biogenesis protein ResB [Coriobacteriia bacterium]|nr:cytochrome c biogenesis protein ResB [Coriobacteriia bacterium]
MKTGRLARVLSWVGSVRLAGWLIATLAALTAMSVVVPQRMYLGESYQEFVRQAPRLARVLAAVGLDRIYGGWPIALVGSALGLNLLVCTARRAMVRRTRQDEESVPPDLREWVSEACEAGWSVLHAVGSSITLVKGRTGFRGSVLMHAGLIVIIIGGVATSLTAFRGEMVISEGQTVSDDPASYVRVSVTPRIGPAYRGTRVTLETMDVQYRQDVVVSATARMRAIEPSGRSVEKDVRVNHPLDAGGKSWLLQDSGYSPRLVVRVEGSQAIPLAVALASETPQGWKDSVVVRTSRGDVRLEMEAVPYPVSPGDSPVGEKLRVQDPRLRLVVVRGSARWQGVLAPGQMSDPVDGVTVVFEDLGLWSRFLVRGEPGRWVTYIGFWVVVLGSAWRFLVPERRVVLQVRADGSVYAVIRVYPWLVRWSGPVSAVYQLDEYATMHSEPRKERDPR